MMRRPIVVAAFVLGTTRALAAQGAGADYAPLDSMSSLTLGTSVTLSMSQVPRRDVVRAISTQSGINIVFDPALPGLEELVSAQYSRVPAATALLRLLAGSSTRAMLARSGKQVVLVSSTRATRKVTGIVTSREGPVSGAHVEITGTSRRTVARDDGTFSLASVPVGDNEIRITRIGYRPLTAQLSAAIEDAPITLTMERDIVPLEAVVVTPGYFGLLESSVAMPQTLSREQLQTVPQIGEDIYRAINRLPGVASTDMSARFSVRGATADQLYVTLDGLRLIEPFHLKDIGGALSIIDIQTLGEASLVSGGAGAAFGDQIGGVFTMHSLDPRLDRSRTAVGISLTNVRANTQGSFADGRGGWLVSGRRGFLDLAFKLANMADSLRPRYDDAFAKVQYALPHGGEIALHGLHSGDNLRYLESGQAFIDSRYLANYGWLTLAQPIGERLRTETVLSVGGLDWRRRGQSSNQSNPFGGVDDQRSLLSLEARHDWSLTLSPRNLINLGFDVRRDRARYDYARATYRSHANAGAVIQTRDSLRAVLAPEGTSFAAYLSNRYQPLGALTLDIGARFDHTAGYEENIASPRAAAALQVTSTSTLRGSWGQYVQAQPLFGLSVEDGQQTFLPSDRSRQSEIAFMQVLPFGMTAQLNVYHRDLIVERPRYINATSRITPFPEVEYDRVLIAPSSGTAQGLELSMSQADRNGSAWSINYAIAKATDRIGARDVPRVTDQRHAVHMDWSYHPSDNSWRFVVAGTWHSGTPDTPDTVRIDTLANTSNRFDVFGTWVPGELYADRVPAYKRLDLRWTRYFETSRGRLSMFAELFNALGTMNTRGYYTNIYVNNRTVSYIRGVRDQMPRLPSAGFTWEY